MKKKRSRKLASGSSSQSLFSKVRTSLRSTHSKVGMKLRFHSAEEKNRYLAMLKERRESYTGRNKEKKKQPNASSEPNERLRVKRLLQGARSQRGKKEAA